MQRNSTRHDQQAGAQACSEFSLHQRRTSHGALLFLAYRFYCFCRQRRTADGGKRNVSDDQYTERASFNATFLIKQLRNAVDYKSRLNSCVCV
jgi:hypothetical protein